MILDGQDPAAVLSAAQALARGELVGLPTETVYGLAADAGSDAAVARIFSVKGRPSDHPLIVHVAGVEGVNAFAHDVPAFAQRLIQAFWPGPLTLILPRRPEAGAAAAAGQDSVGLRCPSHPVAHALLKACEALGVHGLAAPSANLFGRVSPTTAAHVQGEFGDGLLVLDGGACEVGIESTIVDCTRGAPVLLRPGGVTREQIEAACGQPLRTREELASPDPRASGTLEAHYAPQAKVRLMEAQALQTALDVLGPQASAVAVYARSPLRTPAPGVLLRPMPAQAEDAARELFAALRGFDEAGVKLIWVETPPATPAWEGVRDRLQRAAAA
ncbi:MAG: threonylcarbamoyl-AMP synthase [Curvibacter lanceolatus]|jgi:L-threonylcarbamoyladenylate synthase|uniref:L-threonylcarbamoyladenylate synthase n=1 Tax=Curvibacter lanceolatus TaxID=86182 RepID=UPI002357D47B|nr:L-threonylcarbamoyladenylate synthase [Curvibacter lanceolatus]MBV5293732.1 threonylcarbamoyl-AMP synthase [Curvibacter lanceolatus]